MSISWCRYSRSWHYVYHVYKNSHIFLIHFVLPSIEETKCLTFFVYVKIFSFFLLFNFWESPRFQKSSKILKLSKNLQKRTKMIKNPLIWSLYPELRSFGTRMSCRYIRSRLRPTRFFQPNPKSKLRFQTNRILRPKSKFL